MDPGGSEGLYLGFDVGTQATKGVVLDATTARVIARGGSSYGLIPNLPRGAAEQDPQTWVRAVWEVAAELLSASGVERARIRGLGVSGQQHGLVVLDVEDRIVRPAKLWCDTTTEDEAQELSEDLRRAIPAGFTAPKTLWMKRHEPELWGRVHSVLLPHDYINFRLTGRKTMEAGDASGTGFFDPMTRAFDSKAIERIDSRLAEMLRHGLLRGSFVPPAPPRSGSGRELTRYRAALVRERAREVNRLQKTLEGTNLKLGSVATDILGVSGRAILEAVAAGESEAAVLAGLARGRLREKRAELERALAGEVKPHHRLLIAEHLEHIGYLNEAIGRVSREIEERLGPFPPEADQPRADEETLARLQTVPGVGPRTAEVLMAEVGTDMSRFPSHRHLASWAGLCPGNNESAGKRKSGKTRKGSPWLRSALVEAAWAASHSKRTYLSAQYHRLAARRGGRRAVVAVAHTLLVIVYHLLNRGETYTELGGNYFDERDRWQVERRLVRRLEALGYAVSLQPAA